MKRPILLALALAWPMCGVASGQAVTYLPIDLTALAISTGDGAVWNITVSSGPIPGGNHEAWCFSIDPPGYGGSDFGATFQSTAITLNSAIEHAASPGTNKAGAMVNYLYENYFGFWNDSGLTWDEVKDRHNGFHAIIWEIQKDYDPAVGIASFDLNSGGFTTFSGGARTLIFNDLTAAYAGLSPSYVSSQYQLHLISGHDITKNGNLITWEVQPILIATPVPEASSGALLALVALLGTRRRR